MLIHICASAHKEYFYYLLGIVGNRPIAVKIEQYNETWYAKFFFTDLKKDIFLKGNCDSLGCQFSTYEWKVSEGKQHILETFFIKEQPDHTWKGDWIDQNKNTHNIFLHPIKIGSSKHLYHYQPVVRAMDPYSFYRTRDLKFLKVKSEVIHGKYKVDWYEESISGLMFPRVRNGFTKEQRDSINRAFEGIHLKEVENYFSCGAVAHSGEYKLKTEFTFINSELIGLTKETTYNCQSEQASTDKINLTFSADTGHILDLENIFWLGNGTPPPAESQLWYEYRYNVFGSTIKNILTQLYPEKMKSKIGCNYDDPSVWQFPTWYLTDKGLFVGSFSPGIDHTCDAPVWSIIPFKRLEAYKNPAFNF